MAYPLGSGQAIASNVQLNPSLQNRLLNGLTTAEQAFVVLDRISGVGDSLSYSFLTRPATTTPAGTWVREVAALEPYCGHYTNKGGPAANGDNLTRTMFVPSTGVWKMRLNAPRNANGGILKVYIDTVQVGVAGGYDLYNAALDPLNIIEIANVAPPPATVLAAGPRVLKLAIAGKNGASGGFECYLSGISLVRTA